MVNAHARMPFSQRGNALMVSLVFLVILTTLGVSVAGTGRLELMMAANTQFGNQAYQAAESGIDSVLRIPLSTLLSSPVTTPQKLLLQPDDIDRRFRRSEPLLPSRTLQSRRIPRPRMRRSAMSPTGVTA